MFTSSVVFVPLAYANTAIPGPDVVFFSYVDDEHDDCGPCGTHSYVYPDDPNVYTQEVDIYKFDMGLKNISGEWWYVIDIWTYAPFQDNFSDGAIDIGPSLFDIFLYDPSDGSTSTDVFQWHHSSHPFNFAEGWNRLLRVNAWNFKVYSSDGTEIYTTDKTDNPDVQILVESNATVDGRDYGQLQIRIKVGATNDLGVPLIGEPREGMKAMLLAGFANGAQPMVVDSSLGNEEDDSGYPIGSYVYDVAEPQTYQQTHLDWTSADYGLDLEVLGIDEINSASEISSLSTEVEDLVEVASPIEGATELSIPYSATLTFADPAAENTMKITYTAYELDVDGTVVATSPIATTYVGGPADHVSFSGTIDTTVSAVSDYVVFTYKAYDRDGAELVNSSDIYWQKLTPGTFQVTPTPYVTTSINATLTVTAPLDETGLPFYVKDNLGNVVYTGTFDISGGVGQIVISGLYLPEGSAGTWTIDLPYGYTYTFEVKDYEVAHISSVSFTNFPYADESPANGTTFSGQFSVEVTATCVPSATKVIAELYVDDYTSPVSSETYTATYAAYETSRTFDFSFTLTSTPSTYVLVEIKDMDGNVLVYDYYWVDAQVEVSPTSVAWTDSTVSQTISATVTYPAGIPHDAGAVIDDKEITFELWSPSSNLVTSAVTNTGTAEISAAFTESGDYMILTKPYGGIALVTSAATPVTAGSVDVSGEFWEVEPGSGDTVSFTITFNDASATVDHYYRYTNIEYEIYADGSSVYSNAVKMLLTPGEASTSTNISYTLGVDVTSSLAVYALSDETLADDTFIAWANYTVNVSPAEVYAGLDTVAAYTITATIYDETGTIATSNPDTLFVKLYDPDLNPIATIYDNSADDGNSDVGVISFTLTATRIGQYVVEAIYGDIKGITATYKPASAASVVVDAPELDHRPEQGETITATVEVTFAASDFYTSYTVKKIVVVTDASGTSTDYIVSVGTATLPPISTDLTVSGTFSVTVPVDTTGAINVAVAEDVGGTRGQDYAWRAYGVTASPAVVVAGIGADQKYTITGTVTDEYGAPVPGAEVRLYRPTGGGYELVTSAVTTSGGTYTLTATFNIPGTWKVEDGFGASTYIDAVRSVAYATAASIDAPIMDSKPTEAYTVSGTITLTFPATTAYTSFKAIVGLEVDGAVVATQAITGNLDPSGSDISYVAPFSLSTDVLPTNVVKVVVYTDKGLIGEKKIWADYKILTDPLHVYAGTESAAVYTITATIIDETGAVATDPDLCIEVYNPAGDLVETVCDGVEGQDDALSDTGVIVFTLTATRVGDYNLYTKFGGSGLVVAQEKPLTAQSIDYIEGPVYPDGISAGEFTATGKIYFTVPAIDYYYKVEFTINLMADGTNTATTYSTYHGAPSSEAQQHTQTYTVNTTFATAPTMYVKAVVTDGVNVGEHIYWDHWVVTVTPTSVVADSNTVIYTFTGTVTSSSGSPVQGATVTLVKPDSTVVTSTLTDSAGHYVLKSVIDQTGFWQVKTLFGSAVIAAQYGTDFADSIELLDPVRYDTITSTPYAVTATVKVQITATDVYLKIPVEAYVLVDGATAAADAVELNFNPGQTEAYWLLNIPVDVLPSDNVVLVVRSGSAEDHWYVYGYAPAKVTGLALVDVPKWNAPQTAPFDVTFGAELTLTPTDVWTATEVIFGLNAKDDSGDHVTMTTVLVQIAPDTSTVSYHVTLTGTVTPTVFVAVGAQAGSYSQEDFIWKHYDIALQSTTFIGRVDTVQTVSGTVTFNGTAYGGLELALYDPDDVLVATTTSASDGSFAFNVLLNKLGTWTIKAEYGNQVTFDVVRTAAAVTYLEINSDELTSAPVSGQAIDYSVTVGVADTDAFAQTVVVVKYYVDGALVGQNNLDILVDPHQTTVTATDSFTMPTDATLNVYFTAEDGLYSDTTKPWANWSIELASPTIEVDAATQTITGTVYNEYDNTSGVAGATVQLKSGDTVLAEATVQSDGSFAIDYTFTAAGTYELVTRYGASTELTVEPRQAVPTSVELTSDRLSGAPHVGDAITLPYQVTIEVPDYNVDSYMDVVVKLYSGTDEIASVTKHYEFVVADTPTTVIVSGELTGTVTDDDLIKMTVDVSGVTDEYHNFMKLVISNVPTTVYATHNGTITGSLTYAYDGSAVNTTDFADDPMGIQVALKKDSEVIATASVIAGTFEFTGVDISEPGVYTVVPTVFEALNPLINVVYGTAIGNQSIDSVAPDHFYAKPADVTVDVAVQVTQSDVDYITATTVVVNVEEDGSVVNTATAEVVLPEHTTSTVVNVSVVVPEPANYAKIVVGSSEQLLWEKWVLELDDLGAVKEGDVVTITGTLTRYDGTAVSGAAVELVRPDSSVALSVTTDSLGRFTFADVTLDQVGTWTVRTKDDGTTFYASDTFEVQPSEVQTTAESISIGDVTSYEKPAVGAVISVPVTVQITATGIDTYVEVELKDIVDGATDNTVTASVVIPAGNTEATQNIDITIGADASQFIKVVASDINGTATAEAYVWKAYSIVISGYGLEDIESTITGTVTDYTGAPVAGETVKLYDTTDAEVASAVTGADGTFSITFTPASGGTYRVRTTTYKAEADVTVYAYYNMGSGDDLQVAGTQHSYQKPEGTVNICDLVTVTLGTPASQPVYVRVRMRVKVDGGTAATTEYRVLFDTGAQVATMTMCTGEFDGSAANEEIKYYAYDIDGNPNSGVLHGYAYYWMKWVLNVDQDTATIGETAAITGVLTDYNGDAISGAEVGLYNPADVLVATVTTGGDGSFSFDGSLIDQAGTWTVKTVDNGATFYAADTFNAVVYSGEITVSITLEPGWNVITIPVTTTKTLGELFSDPAIASSIYRLEGTIFYYANNDVPQPGVAYWIKNKSTSAITVDITGTVVNDTVDVTVSNAGWVSIGNPFNATYDMDNIVVIKGDQSVTGLQAAIDAGWISSIWFFTGSGWTAADPTGNLLPTKAITFKVLVSEPLIFRWTP